MSPQLIIIGIKVAKLFWTTPLFTELFSPGVYSTVVSDLTGIPLP